ncbi:MAG: gliding motility-associated C-terminal domain-containing protein [Porphyromonas gingivalis]
MKGNNQLCTLLKLCLLSMLAFGTAKAQIQIVGAPSMKALDDSPNRLQVFMLHTLNPASVILRFAGAGTGKLYRYTTKAIEAEEVTTATYSDGMWTLTAPQLNCGYFVSGDGRLPQYYWISNYADYALFVSAVTGKPSETSPCISMDLAVDAAIRPIPYFQPNGIPRRLDRHVQISYPDMEWDAEARLFRPSTKEVEVEASDDERTLVVSASLADAVYTIHGDRFTKELPLPFTAVATDEILTPKVEVYAFVDKVDGGSAIGDNTPEEGDASLVSAPFTVMLAAYGNEPSAANFVWRIYRTEEGAENSVLVYNGTSTEFTFRQAGIYSILLQATNRTGTCTDEVLLENYFKVAESSLIVPNAFSPYGSPGVNDVFRVKHSSLVHFDGRIFDSWGKQIFRWTNPDEGWDGKYRGKMTPTGVYYYVIEAEGADGIKYKRKGDINILRPAYEIPLGGNLPR